MGRNDGVEAKLDRQNELLGTWLPDLGNNIDRLADKLTDQLGGVPQQSRLINALETMANRPDEDRYGALIVGQLGGIVEALHGRPAVLATQDDVDDDDDLYVGMVLPPAVPGLADSLVELVLAEKATARAAGRVAYAAEQKPVGRRHDADIVDEVTIRASSLVPGDIVWWVSGLKDPGVPWAGYRKVTEISADRKLIGMIQITVYDAETDLDYTTPFAGLDLVTVQNPVGARYSPGVGS